MSSTFRRLRLILVLLCALVAVGLGRPAAAMSESHLRAALADYLDDSALDNAATSCLVMDLSDGHEIYSARADRPRIPASNAKLLVSATALELFSPAFTYSTTVWSEADPDDGTVQGDLVIQGYADPIATEGIYAELARQVKLKGVRTVAGDLVGTGPVLLEDHDAGLRAAQRLHDALAAAGITVRGRVRCASCAMAPVLLARHTTLSLAEYLREINKESVNSEAERLIGSLLACFGDPAAPDPRFVLTYWARLGQSGEGLRLADGSGLSREDRLSAALLVGVLRRCAATPAEYQALSRSLPVAGEDGTLADRMQGTAAEGKVRAKTGTLPGVSCLSGYVEGAGNPRLAFSVLMNDLTCPVSAARDLQDEMAAEMARYVQDKWG
jgi:D-alanyl-D-alanine carboxypeptidase/D-alanyl-D-alanine-endopeptidase (penicillin-binding protein 4)